MSNVEAEPEPTELSKTWRYKATNLRVLAHVKQKGNAEDKKVGKSWELLAEGILELCAEIDRLTEELKAKDEALYLMLQAFDPEHPNACTQECFDTSDGHGYEIQEIAKRIAYKALKGEQKSETS